MNLQKAHEILADTDRQHILYRLTEDDGLTTISDLSQQIASCSDIPEESDKPFKHVKIRLIHNHLPRLEDHGVIEYDTAEELETVTAIPS